MVTVKHMDIVMVTVKHSRYCYSYSKTQKILSWLQKSTVDIVMVTEKHIDIVMVTVRHIRYCHGCSKAHRYCHGYSKAQ